MESIEKLSGKSSFVTYKVVTYYGLTSRETPISEPRTPRLRKLKSLTESLLATYKATTYIDGKV